MSFWANRRVLVTGAHGFLGTHVVQALKNRGVPEGALVTPSSRELDLRERKNCDVACRNIDLVFHLAAHVGGIGLHVRAPGEVLYDTSLMGLHLMEAARLAGVKRFVGFGSTCSYPKDAPMPLREETLWDGPSDSITGPYGLAKKLLLVQGQAYRKQYGFDAVHLLPVGLYGPHDHFDEESGHVIPSLVRRFVEAADRGDATVTVWGTGKATRDFLYIEDAAEAILLAAERLQGDEPVNLGSGHETPIAELVALVARAAGFHGTVTWDPTRPDGVPRRSVDVQRAKAAFGFTATTPLDVGLARTVAWYRAHR